MDGGVGRKGGIATGGSEQVECDDGLGEQFVPIRCWEPGVTCAQTSNQVILEGPYGPFCGIAAMKVGGAS